MKDQFIIERLNDISNNIAAIMKNLATVEPRPKTGLAWWSGKDKPVIVNLGITADGDNYKVYNDIPLNVDMPLSIPNTELRGNNDKLYWDGITKTGKQKENPQEVIILWIEHNSNIAISEIKPNRFYWITTPEHLSTTPIEPKERPKPKFKVGQMTNKGKINEVKWGVDDMRDRNKRVDKSISDDCHQHWHYKIGNHPTNNGWHDESVLTAVPSIKITLFERFDNGGKTEVRTENRQFVEGNDVFIKDTYASKIFNLGYCAIMIEQGGKVEWHYNPQIEPLLFDIIGGWYSTEEGHHGYDTIAQKITDVINYPKWTVESNGKKLRAYRSKDGQVFVEIDGDYLGFIPEALIKPLGLEGHEMPYILHGKG